ncbi:hypothetical protein Bbelb_105120 [Branchiostoma belcheri]|nr:hypothetical protein Bbelb_105120 [Branchiostoma belcheri]
MSRRPLINCHHGKCGPSTELQRRSNLSKKATQGTEGKVAFLSRWLPTTVQSNLPKMATQGTQAKCQRQCLEVRWESLGGMIRAGPVGLRGSRGTQKSNIITLTRVLCPAGSSASR